MQNKNKSSYVKGVLLVCTGVLVGFLNLFLNLLGIRTEPIGTGGEYFNILNILLNAGIILGSLIFAYGCKFLLGKTGEQAFGIWALFLVALIFLISAWFSKSFGYFT